MNKRGDSWNATQMLIYSLIAVFVLLYMVGLFSYVLSHFKYSTLHTSKTLDEDLLMQRFMRSPDCFVYFDYEINRAYPNVIDWEKFSDEQLNKCLLHKNIKFQLTLENLERNKLKTIKSAGWNNRVERSLSKDVLIKDDRIWRGNLKIDIQK